MGGWRNRSPIRNLIICPHVLCPIVSMPPHTLMSRSSKETSQRIWSCEDARHDQPVICSSYVVPANVLIRLLWWMWAGDNLHSIRAAAGRAGTRTKDTTMKERQGHNTHTHTRCLSGTHTDTQGKQEEKASTLVLRNGFQSFGWNFCPWVR